MSAGFMVKRDRVANRRDSGQSSEFHLKVASAVTRRLVAARGQLKLELRAAEAGDFVRIQKKAGKSFPAGGFSGRRPKEKVS